MNRGLKNYTKQLTQTVGNAGTVSVNIKKNDANMHIVLPVLKTIGLAPIDLKMKPTLTFLKKTSRILITIFLLWV